MPSAGRQTKLSFGWSPCESSILESPGFRRFIQNVLLRREFHDKISGMSTNADDINQFEGPWDDLIRHSEQFAGRRVRVTVLPGDNGKSELMASEIRRWLAEGDALNIAPPGRVRGNAFGDALVEKFRKQGLVL
jgi:hypothetical protein